VTGGQLFCFYHVPSSGSQSSAAKSSIVCNIDFRRINALMLFSAMV
jgi:hypothetical protein